MDQSAIAAGLDKPDTTSRRLVTEAKLATVIRALQPIDNADTVTITVSAPG